jgi:uncharacterized protein (TIGR02145 family)
LRFSPYPKPYTPDPNIKLATKKNTLDKILKNFYFYYKCINLLAKQGFRAKQTVSSLAEKGYWLVIYPPPPSFRFILSKNSDFNLKTPNNQRRFTMKTKRFLLAVAFATMTFTLLSCSSDDPEEGGNNPSSGGSPVTIGGKEYKTVEIGTQTWMAENLNYNVEGSKCYSNLQSNCDIYGRLYDWSTALTVCPSGWHLPTKADWEALIATAGGDDIAGTKLRAKSGWSGNSGTNDYGFSALPGGGGDPEGDFHNVGSSGYWWSATAYYSSEEDRDNAYLLEMWPTGVEVENFSKSNLLSVRCLKGGSSNNPSSSSVGSNGNPSSSSSGGNDQYGAGACYATPMPDAYMCMRFSSGLTEAHCELLSEKDGFTYTYRESCESNPAFTCETVNAVGATGVIYFYGTLPAGFTCPR